MTKKITPPLLYKICIFLMLLSMFLPIKKQIVFPFNLLGIILLFYGSYIAVVTKQLFKETKTPICPLSTPTQLHTQGFFKFTRNPMYLGISIGLAGVSFLTGIIFNLLFVLFYICIMNFFFIRMEEKKLEEQFKDAFIFYKKKVRRWL